MTVFSAASDTARSSLGGALTAAAEGLGRYRPDQLALLREFLEGGRRRYEEQAARLETTQKRTARTK